VTLRGDATRANKQDKKSYSLVSRHGPNNLPGKKSDFWILLRKTRRADV
jgi:hypothetical protein